MVIIQQDVRLKELNSFMYKLGTTDLKLNIQAIEDDVQRLHKDLEKLNEIKATNKQITKKNISNIIKYLDGILKKVDDVDIKINWYLDKKIIRSYPIEMKNIPEYKVLVTDYINVHEEDVLIHLDFTELADLIAFEIMYRDLGETNKSIEEKLKGIGIIAFYESSIVSNIFTDSPYKLSKVLRVLDSPYINYCAKTIKDYFGTMEFNIKEYKDVVSYSCNVAMSIIVEYVFKNININNVNFRLCEVSESSMHVLCNKDKENLIRQLTESVGIRIFGRKLEVKPKIQVF